MARKDWLLISAFVAAVLTAGISLLQRDFSETGYWWQWVPKRWFWSVGLALVLVPAAVGFSVALGANELTTIENPFLRGLASGVIAGGWLSATVPLNALNGTEAAAPTAEQATRQAKSLVSSFYGWLERLIDFLATRAICREVQGMVDGAGSDATRLVRAAEDLGNSFDRDAKRQGARKRERDEANAKRDELFACADVLRDPLADESSRNRTIGALNEILREELPRRHWDRSKLGGKR